MTKLRLFQLLEQHRNAEGLKRRALELLIIDSGLIKLLPEIEERNMLSQCTIEIFAIYF